jgi:hypothetical protein
MTSTKNPDQIERTESGSQRQTEFAPLRISHILAPTDLTRESRKAVNYALWLARCFHARLPACIRGATTRPYRLDAHDTLLAPSSSVAGY